MLVEFNNIHRLFFWFSYFIIIFKIFLDSNRYTETDIHSTMLQSAERCRSHMSSVAASIGMASISTIENRSIIFFPVVLRFGDIISVFGTMYVLCMFQSVIHRLKTSILVQYRTNSNYKIINSSYYYIVIFIFKGNLRMLISYL